MQPIIGIIGGKGQMGQLFAQFFKDRGLKVLISDLATKMSNTELAQKADICIVSVPIDKTAAVIKEIIPHAKGALLDLTSVKEMPVKAMLKAKCEVMGMHPMFGSTNPIPGQNMILCKTKKSKELCLWLENFLKKNGVKISYMTAKEHDKLMNVAQGLIHFSDISFADALRRSKIPVEKLFQYTSRASEMKAMLAARLIAQDPNLYANIQIQNPNTLKSLKQYEKSIKDLIKIIKKKDLKAFEKYFNKNKKFLGNYTKKAYQDSSYLIEQLLNKNNKGQLHQQTNQPSNQHPNTQSKPSKPSKTKIATLGPANTFSDIAAQAYLDAKDSKSTRKNPIYYAKDINEVFELVATGKVKEGIVPIENKLHGSVRETMDALFQKNVHISAEVQLPIHHCLITHPKAKKITTILSHPQALSQCKNYLNKHYPKAEKLPSSSTGRAIQKIDQHTAAIAPIQAANGLKVLAKNIEDEKNNSTTFIVIKKGKHKMPKTNSKTASPHKTKSISSSNTTSTERSTPKTSIAFHFNADSPGSLFTVFKDFSDAKINMTKIESRPTKAKFGDYIFYLDFEGHSSNPKIQKTLQKVESKVAKLKILGSY